MKRWNKLKSRISKRILGRAEQQRSYLLNKVGLMLLICFLLVGSNFPVEAATQTQKERIQSYSDISKLISNTWEEEYFGKIIVDPDTGIVEKDGEAISFYKEFDASVSERNAAIKSEDSMEQFLDSQDEDTIYKTETNQDGDIEITAPFQTKRLIVEEDLSEDYGAESTYYNEEDKDLILQFETQAETQAAYEKICDEYGEAVCYPDEVYYIDDVLMDNGTDNGTAISWGTGYMGMDQLKIAAPTLGYNIAVTVAVLDTGLDHSNAMFLGRTVSAKSYNFAGHNSNIMDIHGHGTHVSGIITDATPSNVQLMMLKIANNEGYSSLLTIRTALQYAVKQKADVINMSVGFISVQAEKCTYLDKIINKAYEKGIPIVAAAGNNAVNVNYCYPACNKKTIAISALNQKEQLAYYSNRGKGIDFCAPGSEIVSAKAGGEMVSMSGTSMAAPYISAAIAYLRMMQGNLSVNGVYKELKIHCKDLGSAGKDVNYGWGCPILTDLFNTGIINKTQITGVLAPKLKSVKNTEKGVQISWRKVKDATRYIIYRKKGNGSYKKLATVSSKKTVYIDKKVKKGKKYTYSIKVVKSKKKSGLSNTKTIVRLKTVSNVTAKAGNGKKITFTWKKQGGVNGYQIRLGNRSMRKSRVITITKNVRKVVETGLKKKVYYYQVRSYKNIGTTVSYSAWSTVKKIRVR